MYSSRTAGKTVAAIALACVASCQSAPERIDDRAALIARGQTLFFTETFAGNGRTCGTCHPRENNYTLSAAFIATLPDDDPLFVAERQRPLSSDLEKPAQMREFGVILENQDGFEDLANNFNLRGVPHLLSLSTSVASSEGPHTGWSGDGAPGDGSVRAFAVAAVIQHFPRTLARVPGVDFRLPTDEELDALAAFVLSLGRQHDLALPLELKDPSASLGQRVFLDNARGKCNVCHSNAGANVDAAFFGGATGNLNFNTGVTPLPNSPDDDGFGTPGNHEFNTPPLVEAADTAPYFHNNSAATLEAAVAFYNTAAFNQSPAGRQLAARTGGPIQLDGSEIFAVTVFLRVINALENIRVSVILLQEAQAQANQHMNDWRALLEQAGFETDDAIEVLQASRQHERAVAHLTRARAQIDAALRGGQRRGLLDDIAESIAEQGQARAELANERVL